jgi:hypothetical protein
MPATTTKSKRTTVESTTVAAASISAADGKRCADAVYPGRASLCHHHLKREMHGIANGDSIAADILNAIGNFQSAAAINVVLRAFGPGHANFDNSSTRSDSAGNNFLHNSSRFPHKRALRLSNPLQHRRSLFRWHHPCRPLHRRQTAYDGRHDEKEPDEKEPSQEEKEWLRFHDG